MRLLLKPKVLQVVNVLWTEAFAGREKRNLGRIYSAGNFRQQRLETACSCLIRTIKDLIKKRRLYRFRFTGGLWRNCLFGEQFC